MIWTALIVFTAGYLMWVGKRGRGFAALGKHKDALPPSGPTDCLDKALALEDPLDRWQRLASIAEKAYRGRSQPLQRARFVRCARAMMADYERVAPRLQSTEEDQPLVLPVLRQLAILLDQEGDLVGATAVCRQALAWGVEDGTRTGFAGRLARLRQKQTDASD
jgi:hypothetical protein